MKHIVVIADQPGGRDPALARALELQRASGAKITLMGFTYTNINRIDDPELAKLSRSKLERKLLAKREEQLKALAKKFDLKGPKVKIKTLWCKNISKAVVAFCKEKSVDLLLKSASKQERLLYTPTDWRLMRDCPCPVLISARKSWKKRPCVVAALDFATEVASKRKLNDTIYQRASTLAEQLGEEVHVAFALEIPAPLVDLGMIDARKYAKEKRERLQPYIDRFCAKHGIEEDRLHFKIGAPERAIPSLANKLKADLVVCGTVGRKGVKGKLIGNTVEQILQHLRTDTMSVRP